jgi:hypothetical protein
METNSTKNCSSQLQRLVLFNCRASHRQCCSHVAEQDVMSLLRQEMLNLLCLQTLLVTNRHPENSNWAICSCSHLCIHCSLVARVHHHYAGNTDSMLQFLQAHTCNR